MTQPDFTHAFLIARQSGQAAMQAFAENHLPLVAAMVLRFPPGLYEPEELYQQGCIGLMKALARYQPETGAAFSTYAVPLILGEMRMLARQTAPIHIPRPEREMRQRIRRMTNALTSALGREPTVQELAASLRMNAADLMLLTEEVSVCSSDAVTDEGTPICDGLPDEDDWLTRVELRDMLNRLPEKDRELMRLRFLEGCSQTDTGSRLGMTQMQVSRREAVLKRSLRKAWYDT